MAAAPRIPAEPEGLATLVRKKELHDEMSPKERPSMVKTKEKATHKVTNPAGGDPRKDRDPEKAVRVKERKERRDPVGEKWKTGFAEKSARISKQSCGRQSEPCGICPLEAT